MKFYFERQVLFGFLLTALILAVLAVFSFTSTQRLIDTARLLAHTTRVVNTAEQLIKATIDIQTGQRGYVITGDSAFLEPFYQSSSTINIFLNNLDSLTAKDNTQHLKVNELRVLIKKQFIFCQKVVNARHQDFETARGYIVSREGKNIVDSIRNLVNEIQNNEREVFRKGNTISQTSLQEFQYSFIALAVFICVVIVYLFYRINNSLKARDEAQKRLQAVADENRDLYDNAPCGYYSVDSAIMVSNINKRLLHWLGYKAEEVTGRMKFEDFLAPESKQAFVTSFPQDFEKYKADGYANDLEFEFIRKDGTTFPVVISSVLVFNTNGEFAGSRTTVADNTERKKVEDKIKQINLELEAFTYSVSHDLRAPLRSIDGYTKVLLEDYKARLDQEGHRVVDVIVSNARKMGRLIDDLLEFSHLGRKELVRSPLNMTLLADSVLKEQPYLENVAVKINTILDAAGDHSMIRQVWVNLISNAVKYSQKSDKPTIEINSFIKDSQVVYSIRDNGVGFDMQYAHKLFGVFQRLHKAKDFEGTGVGLALVHRIIQKHDGHVWAEAQINKGATFYFSLPV